MITESADGTPIYFETTGTGDTALVFVHGWMGNARWWDAQRDAFAPTHPIVALDLAGHGKSGVRARPDARGYTDDIVAVVHAFAQATTAKRVVLVGHSMSGVYALLAAPRIEHLAQLILVDTIKNLDQLPPPAQADAVLAGYRADYAGAIANVLPSYLFTPQTPPEVAARLTAEFLAVTGDTAADLLAPLYRTDPRAAARAIRVPVRGIGGDGGDGPALAANRAYFADYAYTTLAGSGHYPMLEQPERFSAALRESLQ